jgi:phosphoribosylamine--glycine ligase
MKVLIVGSGGREHAIAWKVSQSSKLSKLYVAPGNAATSDVAENVDIKVSEINKLADWAEENKIDFTIVGPEEPLSLGLADEFNRRGLMVFGPSQAASQMESSKAFSKDVMLKAGVNTAQGGAFTDFAEAEKFIRAQKVAPVVKADGLAAGKGVVVPETHEEAIQATRDFLVNGELGASGSTVVLETRLIGKEASVIAIISGETVLPLVVSSDHKRIFDNDVGPNTGGVGAISPTPVLSESRLDELTESVFRPVVRELKSRGIDYLGFLYAGVMVSPAGEVSIIEFNCRLGDPETQVLLARLDSDLLDVLYKATKGELSNVKLAWKKDAACCVVLCSAGYPGKVDDGKEITGLSNVGSDAIVFHAGTVARDNKIFSKGGRILGVTALGEDLSSAIKKSYAAVEKISFDGLHYRKDIGRA